MSYQSWIYQTWDQNMYPEMLHGENNPMMTSPNFPRCWPFLAENSQVTGEFPSQRPVTRSFDVFFDLHLNKRLRKQSRRRWFEAPSRSLWRHCNLMVTTYIPLGSGYDITKYLFGMIPHNSLECWPSSITSWLCRRCWARRRIYM